MVTRICLLLLLGLARAAFAAPPTATLDQTAVALGEPVQLTIRAGDMDLSQVDLTPLQTDFEVLTSAASRSESRGRVQSQLDITLYPLHTGDLIVPTLTIFNQRTAATMLHVTAGSNATPAVVIRAWVTPEYPMEREPALLHLLLADDGSLEWDRPPPPNVANAYVLPAGNEQVREFVEASGTRRVTREFRWRVLPLKAVNLTLALPTLDAHKFGKRLRFPAPTVSLHPRPAPAYLPLQLPIGRPVVRTLPPVSLSVNRPANWIVDIDAPGLSADGLRALLGPLHHPALKFYTPTINTVRDNGQDWLRATLSLVPLESGTVTLPSLVIPYFDAASGQLREVRIVTPPLSAKDPRRTLALQVILGSLGALVLTWGLIHGRQWAMRWKRKQAWLRQIDTAPDVTALHTALTRDAPLPSATLRAWSGRSWISTNMIEGLEQLRFGAAQPDADWLPLKTAWRTQAARLPLRSFT